MTKNEYLSALRAELKRRGAAEVDDILDEYAEHFDYKLADGYTEEEIAARLGDPAQTAAQFEKAAPGGSGVQKALTGVGLGFADIFVFTFFCLLWCWVAVLACGAFAGFAVALCLVVPGLSSLPGVYVPYMPYVCGAVLGLALAALGALFSCGTVYFAALSRQLFRAWARLHSNAMARAAGKPVLPAAPAWPQFEPKKKRLLRLVTMGSLAAAVLLSVLAYFSCFAYSGTPEFWHTWNWFQA